MSVTYRYSAHGKFYRTPAGLWVPSAGMVCTALTKENFDYVGIETLERAILQGEGAHRVACDYSLQQLGHLGAVTLPPMPAEFPGNQEEWRASMAASLVQVATLFRDYEVEPIAVEQPDVCSSYSFGGQPDLKCWMRWKKKRIIAVWDYKRVAGLGLPQRLKIECYRMLDGFKDCKAGFIAWLRKDGPAELRHIEPNGHDLAAICGSASVFNWQISQRILIP